MKRLAFLAPALLALVCLAALPTLAGTTKGQTQWGLSGALTAHPSPATLAIQTDYGRYLTKQTKLSLVAQGVWSDGMDQLFGLGRLSFHSATDSMAVPYIGPQAGFLWVNVNGFGSDSKFVYGAAAGIDWYIKDNQSFFAELNYVKVPDSGVDSDYTLFGLFGLRFSSK